MNFSSSLNGNNLKSDIWSELPLELIFYVVAPFLTGYKSCTFKKTDESGTFPEDLEARTFLSVCVWGRDAMLNQYPTCYRYIDSNFFNNNIGIEDLRTKNIIKKLEGGRWWCVLHQCRETQLIENVLTKEKNNRTWLYDPPFDRNIIDKRVIANQAGTHSSSN